MAKIREGQNVHVTNLETGVNLVLTGGDEVPDWAADVVTNPAVLDGAPAEAAQAETKPDQGNDPPESSLDDLGMDELKAYADVRGVDVSGLRSKEAVRDAIRDAEES